MPGTMVQFPNSPKVYVIGEEGKYHWIENEKIAYAIFGKDWHLKIVQVYHWDFFGQEEGEVIDRADKYVILK
jgi:hypothetical protein